jgi:hypothetical protein
MQEALQEDNTVLTASSLSQATAAASLLTLDLVLLATSEDSTPLFAITIKTVQPDCPILAVAVEHSAEKSLPIGVDAIAHVECIGDPVPLRQMLKQILEPEEMYLVN